MYVDIVAVNDEPIRFLQVEDQELGRISIRVRVRRYLSQWEKKKRRRMEETMMMVYFSALTEYQEKLPGFLFQKIDNRTGFKIRKFQNLMIITLNPSMF